MTAYTVADFEPSGGASCSRQPEWHRKAEVIVANAPRPESEDGFDLVARLAPEGWTQLADRLGGSD
jgi:hypothetical protein